MSARCLNVCRHDLGKGPWSSPDGCGQGEGELNLRIKYTPFDGFTRHPKESLTVSVVKHLLYVIVLWRQPGSCTKLR